MNEKQGQLDECPYCGTNRKAIGDFIKEKGIISYRTCAACGSIDTNNIEEVERWNEHVKSIRVADMCRSCFVLFCQIPLDEREYSCASFKTEEEKTKEEKELREVLEGIVKKHHKPLI